MPREIRIVVSLVARDVLAALVGHSRRPALGGLNVTDTIRIQEPPLPRRGEGLPGHPRRLVGREEVEDLHLRGMLENTLVIAMSEFGRTPRIITQAPQDLTNSTASP